MKSLCVAHPVTSAERCPAWPAENRVHRACLLRAGMAKAEMGSTPRAQTCVPMRGWCTAGNDVDSGPERPKSRREDDSVNSLQRDTAGSGMCSTASGGPRQRVAEQRRWPQFVSQEPTAGCTSSQHLYGNAESVLHGPRLERTQDAGSERADCFRGESTAPSTKERFVC